MRKQAGSIPLASDQPFLLGDEEKITTGRQQGLLFLSGLTLAAFFSKLELAPGITPVGIAFAGSWALAGLPGSILIFGTSLLCLQTKQAGLLNLDGIFSVPLFLCLYLKGRGYPRKKYLIYSLLMIGVGAAFLVWQEATGRWLPEGGEAAVAWLLAQLLMPGLAYIKQYGQRDKLSLRTEEQGQLSLGLLALLFYLVLTQLTIFQFKGWQVQLHLFFAFFVLLLIGSKPGSGLVLTMGLLFLLGEAFYGQAPPWYLPLVAGSSLLIDLGKTKGKKGLVVGSLLPLVFTAVFWWGEEGIYGALGQGVTALLVFLLLPRKIYSRWQRVLRGSGALNSLAGKKDQLVEEATAQLQGLAALFLEVSRVFNQPDPKGKEPGEEAMIGYFQEIAQQNCRSCGQYDYCWQEHFYQTYRELFDLLAWAEIEGGAGSENLPSYLAKHCLRKEQLLATVNLKVEKEKAGIYWRRRFYEARGFLAEQLAGISDLVTEIGGQFTVKINFCAEVESRLTTACDELGLVGVEASVLESGERNRIRVRVEKPSCTSGQECRLLIAPLASEICGQRLAVRRENCQLGEEERCSFILTPEPRFGVQSAVVQLPKVGNNISGDYQDLQVLSDHLMVGLLSDGMGVGEGAARLSTSTVNLVRRMLAAGLGKKFALRLLNALLLLASPEEAFATLDLLLFDQLTGEMELFKIGSAPTYIKKGRVVHVVRSTSLPVGIMKTVEPEYYRDYLNHNDLVVLVSDGAVNFKPGGEDWLLKTLRKVEMAGAEPFAQYLLELAKIEADGEINDDLTIMVLQIEERRTKVD